MQFSGPTQRHLIEESDDDAMCPAMRLADMSIWSVQASQLHLCSPRMDYRVAFKSAEVQVIYGDRPGAWEPWWKGNRYGWLPLELIDEEIEKRGGLVDTG
jgi:hypothetical protein